VLLALLDQRRTDAAVVPGSDRSGQFGERRWEAEPGWCVDAEFVVDARMFWTMTTFAIRFVFVSGASVVAGA